MAKRYNHFDACVAANATNHDGCWLWPGAVVNGYGFGMIAGKRQRAHRGAYRVLVGAIPDGLVLDHLCRNKLCINPRHLEPVTHRENILRGVGRAPANLAKQACPRGHEYTPQNTYVHAGRRHCRECGRAVSRAYHVANRDALLQKKLARRERLRRHRDTGRQAKE